jgi:hypothetical protein
VTPPKSFISRFAIGLLVILISILPSRAFAQSTAHYPTGIEGIKAGSLPPPGLYFRDYNVVYTSSELDDASGHEIHGSNLSNFVYAQVPRLVWITDRKFLGGYVGVDFAWPIVDLHTSVNTPGGPFTGQTVGFGDPFLQSSLSWHPKAFDFGLAVGEWFPLGRTAPPPTTKIGLGYWETMLTAGMTWYPDADKKWAISLLNRYEISSEQRNTHITPGNAYTLEWGLSNSITPLIDLGIVGYYQKKVTPNSGTGASHTLDSVAAVGPEISMVFPKLKMVAGLSYYYEFMAEARAKGQQVTLLFTWKL